VARKLWKDVLANKAQLDEWKKLYALDPKETLFIRKGEVNEHFLEEHPTLVVNTTHLDKDFTLKALAAFEDLEEATDGLLIHAENYQALRLLERKFEGKIKCIHIDPPYNTQTSRFLYKNTYQHSSWLAMMESRIKASARLMAQDGAYLCHIDENEYELLHLLFTNQGIPDMGTIVWDKKNPMLGRKGVATQHEYIIWRSRSDSPPYLRSVNVAIILSKAESLIEEHGGVNEKVRREFAAWISNYEGLSGGERAYRLIGNDGTVFRGVAMGAPEPRKDPKFHIPLIHPITKKACPVPNNGWSRTPETLQQLIDKDEILFGEDETAQPQRKVFLTDESKRQLSSVIADAMRGKTDLIKLGLEFPYCHPVSLYQELLGAAAPDENDVVLDHFAGSGTTAHALINLNREDGGQRKFILAEIGDYFDTVLVPRIQKVIYTPEWKDGKPTRPATKEEAERTPRLVKVLRLEGYEDALHNLTTEETLKPEQTAAKAHKVKLGADTYRLRCLAKLPLEANASMLNLEKLEHPFNYTIEILTEDGPKAETVDLVETFNYLYAIDVQRIETWVNEKDKRECRVVKGKNREGRSVLVLWRDMGNLDPKVERAFLEAKVKSEGHFDEMLINGDTATPGFVSLDPVFKRLVEEEER
jgi:adenine-specific DNA-methyltransferase